MLYSRNQARFNTSSILNKTPMDLKQELILHQMNGNVFLWINIHLCLYITEYTLFNKTLNIYAFVKISGLIRKHEIFSK